MTTRRCCESSPEIGESGTGRRLASAPATRPARSAAPPATADDGGGVGADGVPREPRVLHDVGDGGGQHAERRGPLARQPLVAAERAQLRRGVEQHLPEVDGVDAVDQRQVRLPQHRDPAVLEPLDEVRLPQRAAPVERARDDPGDQLAQLLHAPGARQRGAAYVEGEVEVRVVHPGRRGQPSGHRLQPAAGSGARTRSAPRPASAAGRGRSRSRRGRRSRPWPGASASPGSRGRAAPGREGAAAGSPGPLPHVDGLGPGRGCCPRPWSTCDSGRGDAPVCSPPRRREEPIVRGAVLAVAALVTVLALAGCSERTRARRRRRGRPPRVTLTFENGQVPPSRAGRGRGRRGDRGRRQVRQPGLAARPLRPRAGASTSPPGTTTLTLTIDEPGVVEVESHELEATVLQLEVS